jgi:hypothetical protein
MGCTESVPVQEPYRTQVIYTQTPQNTNYNNQKTYKNEDPINYNQKQPTYVYPQQTNYNTQSSVPLGPSGNKVSPPPYGYYNNTVTPTAPPALPIYSNYPTNNLPMNYQHQQYVAYQYPTQYPPQYNQYPPQYSQQQPSMLATMGAVAGGVIVGDMISDALFD